MLWWPMSWNNGSDYTLKLETFYKNKVLWTDIKEKPRCLWCEETAIYNITKRQGGNLTVNFHVCFHHGKVISHILYAFDAHHYGVIKKI